MSMQIIAVHVASMVSSPSTASTTRAGSWEVSSNRPRPSRIAVCSRSQRRRMKVSKQRTGITPPYRHSNLLQLPRAYFLCLNLACRSDISPSDPRKDNMGVRMLRLDIRRRALSASAWSVATAVKPSHILAGIVPNAHG